jgi:hypothetical protein
MSTQIEVTILESRFEHPSEYLFDRESVCLELDDKVGRIRVTTRAGQQSCLRLCSDPFDPHIPVCEPMCLTALPGLTDEGYEADWHIYPAQSCSRADFEALLAELSRIGWPTVRI